MRHDPGRYAPTREGMRSLFIDERKYDGPIPPRHYRPVWQLATERVARLDDLHQAHRAMIEAGQELRHATVAVKVATHPIDITPLIHQFYYRLGRCRHLIKEWRLAKQKAAPFRG